MTDLDPESRHILELATAARTPSASDKTRVTQRLDAVIGGAATAAGTHAAASGTGATKSASIASLKWIAAGTGLAAIVATYVAITPQQPTRRPPRPNAPVQAEPALPAVATPSASASASASAPQHTPHRVEHRRPVANGAADEISLLHRAQAAWRAQDPKTALALLDEHRTRYPHTQLAPERDALQALSLCDLGKHDEGRRLARSVLARAPRSPLRASLEQSCALK